MRMDADFCPPAPPYDSFTVRPAKVNSRSRRLLSSMTTALLFSPLQRNSRRFALRFVWKFAGLRG